MPWRCMQGGRLVGAPAATRQAAQNRVEKPWRPGFAFVINTATGERWERRSGSWFKARDGKARRARRQAAEPASAPPPRAWWLDD